METAAVAILPFPYEGGVSYGKGAAGAPEQVLRASHYLELYDEVYGHEFHTAGITTAAPPAIPSDAAGMIQAMETASSALLNQGKFVCVLGGDHSVSSGFFNALHRIRGVKSVIQIDAHTDLREEYEGSRLSHACVMARIRQHTRHTLHIGIRSMSKPESVRIKEQHIPCVTMHDLRAGKIDIGHYLEQLPDPVFLTFDVDALDWSIISSTGTPEPGGLLWHETMEILEKIFFTKDVAGCDIVELAANPADANSPFAAAKLLYKMITLKIMSSIKRNNTGVPLAPCGPILQPDML